MRQRRFVWKVTESGKESQTVLSVLCWMCVECKQSSRETSAQSEVISAAECNWDTVLIHFDQSQPVNASPFRHAVRVKPAILTQSFRSQKPRGAWGWRRVGRKDYHKPASCSACPSLCSMWQEECAAAVQAALCGQCRLGGAITVCSGTWIKGSTWLPL